MIDDLSRMLADMANRLTEVERKLEQSSRDGKAIEIDHDEGLAKVEIGSSNEPSSTHWVPWMEQSGDHESYDPPTVGEPVTVRAPNGEMSLARIERGAPSNRANRPHREAGERLNKMDQTSILQTSSKIVLSAGGASLTISDAGFDFVEGYIKHNGTTIDDTHIHSGVVEGLANTKEPV